MNAVTILAEHTVLGLRFNLAPDSKRFRCNFIEPGLVSYRDTPGGGIELLRKETIDRCLASAIGNPLTVGHTAERNNGDNTHGVIEQVTYDAADGWYYAEGPVDTDEARSRLRRNQRPSCGYAVLEFGPGGTYHGIKYDREITNLEFRHLAIVEKPRYEDAVFRLNAIVSSCSSKSMNVFKFLKTLVTRENGTDGKPVETKKVETSELSGETEIVVDGVPVRLNEAAEIFSAANPAKPVEASQDDEIEVGGKPVKVSALAESVRAHRKNAAAKTEAEQAAVKAKEQETARLNEAEKNKNQDSFFQLRHARENAAARAVEVPKGFSGSIIDRVKAGQLKYGSSPVIVGKN